MIMYKYYMVLYYYVWYLHIIIMYTWKERETMLNLYFIYCASSKKEQGNIANQKCWEF